MNGRKLPVWNMEKSSSIPYHALVTKTTRKCRTRTGAPRAEREPGDRSNMDGPPRFCDVQNRRRKSKKKVFTEISTVKSTLAVLMALLLLNAILLGPLSSSWAPGLLSPLCPPLGGPARVGSTRHARLANLHFVAIALFTASINCTIVSQLQPSQHSHMGPMCDVRWVGGQTMHRATVLAFMSVPHRRVARNSQWGGCFGGLGAELPAAGGQWGSGGGAPSCRRLGVWGQSPQPPEARGCGGGAPSTQKFCIFLQK